MRQRLGDQRGITLVETLLAAALLVTLIISAMSVFFIGHRSTQYMVDWGDQTQALRIGMKQITDDVAFADRDWGSPVTLSSREFYVEGYRPVVDRNAGYWDWSSLPEEWPGDLVDLDFVTVHYVLEGDKLIREVSGNFGVVSRQVSAAGLIPYGDPSGDGSYLVVDDASGLIKVMLRTDRKKAGVNSVAEVYAEFHVR